MTTIDTTTERERTEFDELDLPTPVAADGARVRLMALGLWGVVGSLLAYGVVQTVLKAAALCG